MRIYLSGPITGHEDTAPKRFLDAELHIIKTFGAEIISPWIIGSYIGMAANLTHEEYMKISFALMDLCDSIYFLPGWEDSKGCQMEMIYAKNTNMHIIA